MNSQLKYLKTNLTVLVFCALAVLVPMTAFFSTRAVVPLTILAVLVGTFDQIRRREWRFPIDAMTAILLGAVVLWALISAAWALDSFLAFRGAGKILGNVTIGILLLGLALKLRDEFQPKLLGYALTVGMVIALSALTIDPLFNQPFSALVYGGPISVNAIGLYWLNASTAILIVLVWPLIVFLKGEKKLFWGLVILAWLTWVTHLIGFNTGLVVIGISAVLFIPLLLLRARAFAILSVLVAAAIFLSPFVLPRVFDPVVYAPMEAVPKPLVHRMYIWKFASGRLLEKPFVGWGMNAARVIPGGKERATDKFRASYGEFLPLHPHNAGLQIWLELGIPGTLAFAALLAILLQRARALGLAGVAAPFLLLQFLSAFLFSEVSFGIWQSWWQAVLWINIALAVLLCRPPPAPERAQPG
jgi:O-antigen ligase